MVTSEEIKKLLAFLKRVDSGEVSPISSSVVEYRDAVMLVFEDLALEVLDRREKEENCGCKCG